jgi:L-lactate utilization protein LutC
MSQSNRAEFLARVSAAVRTGNRYREQQSIEMDPSIARLDTGGDLIVRLVRELEAVGCAAHRVDSVDAVHRLLGPLLDRSTVRSAMLNGSALIGELRLKEWLEQQGVAVLASRELTSLDEGSRRDRVFAADLGIAQPDWAIAETGTLVYASGPVQTRSCTLLPPIHVAVVHRSCVLADLVDLPSCIATMAAAHQFPGNTALVTGPSKTGDIELRLTTGVHGPGEVHVLIWDPPSASDVNE